MVLGSSPFKTVSQKTEQYLNLFYFYDIDHNVDHLPSLSDFPNQTKKNDF